MNQNKIYSIYFYLFAAILTLPLVIFPPFVTSPDWDKTIVFRCLLSVILAIFLWQTYRNRGFSEIKQKIRSIGVGFWTLALVFIIFLLSTILSRDISFSLWGSPYRAGGFVTFTFYMLFAILAFLIIKREDWKKILDWSLVVGWLVGLVAIFQKFQIFSNLLHPYDSPPSTTGNSSWLAIYMLLLFFVALGLFFQNNSNKKQSWRIFYGITLVFFSFVIIISNSRSSYLGLLAGFLYFILLFPQKNWKIRIVQISGIILVLMAASLVVYVNVRPMLPSSIRNIQFFSRLSLKPLAEESRFSVWQVSLQAIKEKPILGWGPENFQIGFDKFYDPSLPKIAGIWWDRAHNIFLDTAVSEGILGLIAYLALFAILFWQLQKIKGRENSIHAHMLQGAILAYFIADFFSFDSFVMYIALFLIVGYSFSLIKKETTLESAKTGAAKEGKLVPGAILVCLFAFVLFFNIFPYYTGRATGLAEKLQKRGDCKGAIAIIGNASKAKNYASAHAKLKYGEISGRCGLAYMEQGIRALEKATLKIPKYTKLWVALSGMNNVLQENEADPSKRQELSQKEKEYIKRGLELSPKRQELFMEKERNLVLDKNYEAVIPAAEDCIKIQDQFGGCYWYLGVANIFLGTQDEGKRQVEIARNFGYEGNLNQLTEAYLSQNDYSGLRDIYFSFTNKYPGAFEYHAYLAFAYKMLGEYRGAREEAIQVIKLGTDEAIQEAKEFIKTLPPPFNNPDPNTKIFY